MVRFLWRRLPANSATTAVSLGNPRAVLLPMHLADRPNGCPTSGRFGVWVVQTVQASNPNAIRWLSRGKGGVEFKSLYDIVDHRFAHSGPPAPAGEHASNPEKPKVTVAPWERLGGKRPQAVIRSIRQGQGVGDPKVLRIKQKGRRTPQSVVTGFRLCSNRSESPCGAAGSGWVNSISAAGR